MLSLTRHRSWNVIFGVVGGCIALVILVIALSGGSNNSSARQFEGMTFDEARARSTTVSYDDLFRNNERHVGKIVYFRGQLIQVIGTNGHYQMRANVTPGQFTWDDTVALRYVGERLPEEDIVEFVGEVKGLQKYKNESMIPNIDVIQLRVVAKRGTQ